MQTLTLQVGEFYYPEEKHGPPLPKSDFHWSLWHCYEHPRRTCIVSELTRTPGQKVKLKHTPITEIAVEAATHTDNCRCYRHWLLGKYEAPGFPYGHEFYYLGY